MLKLIYADASVRMEHLAETLETWVTARVLLSLRAGTPLFVEPTTACFLLPADLPQLAALEAAVARDLPEAIALDRCDTECVEVSLHGTWLAESAESDTGSFVAALPYNLEFFLYKVWQAAEAIASVPSD